MKEVRKILVNASHKWRWVGMLFLGLVGCGDAGSSGQAKSQGAPTYVDGDEPPMLPAQFGAAVDGNLARPVYTGFLLGRDMSKRFAAWAQSGDSSIKTKSLGGQILGGLGCMSFAPNGPSFTVVLNQCVIEDDPMITLSGDATAAYNKPCLDVALDATVNTPEAVLNFGGDLRWADLLANPVPEITLHGGVTAAGVSVDIAEMKLIFEAGGYKGLLIFDVTNADGSGVSSSGVVVLGDAESFTVSGPVVMTVPGVQARGEARDVAIRYTELLPHGGSLKVTAEMLGWTIEQRTYYQTDTPATGWVLSQEYAQGQKPNGEVVEVDRWNCMNLGTLETHEAFDGATCPVQ